MKNKTNPFNDENTKEVLKNLDMGTPQDQYQRGSFTIGDITLIINKAFKLHNLNNTKE